MCINDVCRSWTLEKGTIHPEKLITHRLALDELENGLHIMRDKTEYYCKVMAVS